MCSVLNYSASENTFAGHWETVVDCMENIEKRLAMINFTKDLPKNTTVVPSLMDHQNIWSSIQKVPLTALSRASL